MINAASSIASGVLSATLGTPAASGTASSAGTLFPAATSSASSSAYLIDESLLSAIGGASGATSGLVSASFLSNAEFAADTAALLSNPLANGKITGTPSNNVQKLLSEIDPSVASATTTPTTPAAPNSDASDDADGTSDGSDTAALPADGILA